MAEDFARSVRELKSHKLEFCLRPASWRSFRVPPVLRWKEVKFEPASRTLIPQSRGVYAFIAQPEGPGLPPHGYLMYVGITGDATSRTLRTRYGDYLVEQKVLKRANIHFMLKNWAGHLRFSFAPVLDRRYSLRSLEKKLCDALIPPFNSNDFSAELRPKVRAMR